MQDNTFNLVLMDACENGPKADSDVDLGVKLAARDIKLKAEESPASMSNPLVRVEDSSVVPPAVTSPVAPEASALLGAPAAPSRSSNYGTAGTFQIADGQIAWPKTRRRQLLNLAYFGVFGTLFALLSRLYGGQYFPIAAVLCFAMTAASGFYLVSHRSHVSCDDELPVWARRSLRFTAIIFPLLIVGLWTMPFQATQAPLAAAPVISSSAMTLESELALADKLYKDEDYGGAVTHYLNVVGMDPRNERSYSRLSDSYLRSPNFNDAKSIENADKALKLNPNNLLAASSKAWALNNLDRYAEALVLATAVTEKDPTYGEAFASIANSQRGLHNFAAALKADNEHVRLHDYEGQAYRDRAETLTALGRDAEAKADLERAKKADADDE